MGLGMTGAFFCLIKSGDRMGTEGNFDIKKALKTTGLMMSNLLILQWSRRSDLNRGPADYESAALPLSYAGIFLL